MKIKSKYKKIFLILMMILIVSITSTLVDAAITTDDGVVGKNQSDGATIANSIMSVINYILSMATSGVFATICWLIVVLTVVLFAILYVIFGLTTSTLTFFPTPDNIVFNRIAIFDSNFVNPANQSILSAFGSTLKDLFASFQTIAIAVFVIAAMIVGIQIALSTVASKKAQYKEAAVKWVTGLVLLISVKWIVAGIFYINELIVAQLYTVAKESADVLIPVHLVNTTPITRKTDR